MALKCAELVTGMTLDILACCSCNSRGNRGFRDTANLCSKRGLKLKWWSGRYVSHESLRNRTARQARIDTCTSFDLARRQS